MARSENINNKKHTATTHCWGLARVLEISSNPMIQWILWIHSQTHQDKNPGSDHLDMLGIRNSGNDQSYALQRHQRSFLSSTTNRNHFTLLIIQLYFTSQTGVWHLMNHFPVTGTCCGFAGGWDESWGLQDRLGLHAPAQEMETEIVHLDL